MYFWCVFLNSPLLPRSCIPSRIVTSQDCIDHFLLNSECRQMCSFHPCVPAKRRTALSRAFLSMLK